MKTINKTLFSLFVIFALLFNDFVITTDDIVKQKTLFHHITKNLSSSSDSLKNKKEAENNLHQNGVNYRLKSERNNKISAVVDRAKANVKELITLLVLSAVALVIAIGFSIGKSYIDSKREKENEIFKKEVLTQKIEQQIEKEKQNELFIEYCQLFQTLGKLVESNILLGKFHVGETSESLAFLKDKAPSNTLISKVDSIVAQFTNEEKQFTRQTYENCYNAFHFRTVIPDVGGISKDLTFEEGDFVKMKETIIAAKTQVKEAVKVDPSDYLKLAELVEKGSEAYSTVSEIKSKGEENKLEKINSYNPINIEEPAKTFIGDAKIGGQIASGAWSLYKKIVELDEISDTAEKEKLGNARKGLAYVTCGWEMLENVFKTSNSVVGNIGGTSLNIPFTGLVTVTLKLISAISNYKVAYSEWSKDKTDLKDLAKNLKFWDMMDAICDLLQELANDLILISPLTVGVSAVLGIALKVVFGLIGVFTAWMRLKKSRDIHKKIIAGLEKVTKDQKKNTKSMSEELTKKYCAQINEILRQYLNQEFSRFEKDLLYKRNLVEEQYDADLAEANTPNLKAAMVANWNSKIEAANDHALKVICAYSHDNCLKSYNALSEKYYYPFDKSGYQRYAQAMFANAVSSIRTGPINSALSVLQGTDKTQSIQFSLMTNGYVPAYQSSTFNIFVCRSCLDTSLLVESKILMNNTL